MSVVANTRRTETLVVGGGIVGAAVALELARRGVEVLVVDRAEIGHGCSYGNAGWLTPSLAFPLPAPGVLGQGLLWLFRKDSPLRIEPRLSLDLARWLWGFVRATDARRFRRGLEALTALSLASLDEFRGLAAESGVETGFRPSGRLSICETAATLEAERHEIEVLARFGLEARLLGVDEVRALVPALTGPLAGALLTPGDAVIEPLAAVEAMAAQARRLGARFESGVEVYDFERRGGRITAVATTAGPIAAGRIVLAAGSWSKGLAANLGFRLPVLGGKGYALIVPPLDPQPPLPLKLLERRIAVTPRADSLRIAGTLEVVDADWSVSPRRVAAIVAGARAMLALPDPPEIREVWHGLRPVTPDGLPILGRAPGYENLFLATGHQMLGLHCAPASGRLIAELALGETPSFDPAPFRAERF
jgi:D-amino-acid dehydrogenase